MHLIKFSLKEHFKIVIHIQYGYGVRLIFSFLYQDILQIAFHIDIAL